MDFLLSFFQFLSKSFFALGPFVILLGVLIFIHELGHFLAARYFGVKVEVFSLGFGPKILKYKKADTLYCLSLFPLGGYVKMFGSNPLEELSEEEKTQAFLYKKVHQKWLIAFAGPLMNLVFTVLAFFMLAKIGVPSLPPLLGDIQKDTQAYKEGFRSGDLVLSVNGQKISYYEQLAEKLKHSKGKSLDFKIKASNKNIKEIKTTVQKKINENPLERKKEIGFIEGLTVLSTGLRVGIIEGSQAYKNGLRTFDEIVKVNDQPLRYWRDLSSALKSQNRSKIVFKRDSKEKTIFLSVEQNSSLTDLGIEPSFLYIEKTGADTPANQAGLKKGDRLVSIQGEKLLSWEQVLNTVKNSKGAELKIKYQRGEKINTVFISPKPLFVEGNIKTRYMLGIVSGAFSVFPPDTVRVRAFFESISYSMSETVSLLGSIALGLGRLIQGEISIRTLGGPVAIGRLAHRSFHHNLLSFLSLMALISLNLFFLNLLPIPLLDGGHILFFTLEGILGRPISVKKLLLAQQLGLVFIFSFMGLALFNDIYNFLKAW